MTDPVNERVAGGPEAIYEELLEEAINTRVELILAAEAKSAAEQRFAAAYQTLRNHTRRHGLVRGWSDYDQSAHVERRARARRLGETEILK